MVMPLPLSLCVIAPVGTGDIYLELIVYLSIYPPLLALLSLYFHGSSLKPPLEYPDVLEMSNTYQSAKCTWITTTAVRISVAIQRWLLTMHAGRKATSFHVHSATDK